MAKLKLTKNELKKQKEALKRFNQYLPTLQLKKQQLQAEKNRTQRLMEEESGKAKAFKRKIEVWAGVFGEDIGIKNIISLSEVLTNTGNVAGVDVPIFRDIRFNVKEYDLFETPMWLDDGLEAVREMITFNVKINLLMEQFELIQKELKTTTQRVNLFEKVKIPQTKESIRKISIFLGDVQTAAVVTGKIAKAKIEKKEITVIA